MDVLSLLYMLDTIVLWIFGWLLSVLAGWETLGRCGGTGAVYDVVSSNATLLTLDLMPSLLFPLYRVPIRILVLPCSRRCQALRVFQKVGLRPW